jgi:hypothetical protein
MFVPFIELREYSQKTETWLELAVASFQSTLSLALVAMILIALRWRFRKG